ncbi:MAG: multicopper oxidase family protein [Vicinamibacterales bacterium]
MHCRLIALLCAATWAGGDHAWSSTPQGNPASVPRGEPIVQTDGRRIWEYTLVVTEGHATLANGARYKVWAFNGRVPGPTLVAKEGEWVRITLVNETSVPHTIHSHGLYVPHRMDGVPHDHGSDPHHPAAAPRPAAVAPGERFTYEYLARPAGTHFYHCHVNTNEHLERGMAGILVVLPAAPEPAVDHDFALLLDEWDSRFAQDGTPGHPRDIGGYDFFTINGRSFPETPPLQVSLGEVVRLRIINAGSLPHSVHLHGHGFLVTHQDGARVPDPARRDTIGVSPGERVDLVLVANNPGLWPIHCHVAMHQTNAGQYPGGMMVHMQVGPDPFPTEGQGPRGRTLEDIAHEWRTPAPSAR